MKPPARRVVTTWLVATLIAGLISLLVGQRIRNTVFDSWQAANPRDLGSTDVRVVLIDNASIDAVGTWPWPRYYLARLTEELAARKASVIAFDIFFSEPDRVRPETFVSLYPELSAGAASEVRALEPMDELFGRVIGTAPVILAHAGIGEAPATSAPLPDAPVTGSLPPNLDSWPGELAAIPVLDDVALGQGLANAKPDTDGVTRAVPLLMRAGGKLRTGFALEVARNALNTASVHATPTTIRFADRVAPVDRRGRMRLHFGTFPANRIVSAADILGNSRQIGPGEFEGKPVLVGLSADGTSDIAATPTKSEEWGPLVQAQAVDALLRGGWLDRPTWAGLLEWAGTAMIALLSLGIASFGRSYRIALGAIAAAIPAACWLAFTKFSMLIDPARPLLVGGGAAAGVAIGLFALARADRERLRDALVQERIATAETEGELQAARAIQLGMVPPREKLRNIDPRVDLDAILEPAKSVGGDFYDAVKVGDDLLAVAIADVTGKGVPAALFMALSKALTGAALSRPDADPAAMASTINGQLLKDYGEAMSVTMLLAILDLRSGSVRLACAGHDDPLLVPANGPAKPIRLEGGPPLSIVPFPYPSESLKLEAGDTLLLITDGVTEAQDADGVLFGCARLLAEGLLAAGTASEICDAVRRQVRAFEDGTEATDDLTIMALRYLGS